MLGRFALASSFSRRSSPGFSIGSTGFGFRFWERAFPSVCIMSIHIHQIPLFKAAISVRSPEDDPRTLPPAVFHDSHMGLVARIGSKFRIQTRLPDMLG